MVAIPLDICEVIIGIHQHNPRVLKRCSLVCQSWRHIAQRHIFRQVKLILSQNDMSRYRFLAALRNTPSISWHVQDLKVSLGDFRYSLQTKDPVAKILPLLRSVRKMTLSFRLGLRHCKNWLLVETRLQAAILYILTTQNIFRIEIDGVENFPFNKLSSCPSLEHLILGNVPVQTDEDAMAVDQDEPTDVPINHTIDTTKFQLLTLQMKIANPHILESLYPHVSRLKAFSVEAHELLHHHSISWLLRRCSRTLEQFVFKPSKYISYFNGQEPISLGILKKLRSICIQFDIHVYFDTWDGISVNKNALPWLFRFLSSIQPHNYVDEIVLQSYLIGDNLTSDDMAVWNDIDAFLAGGNMPYLRSVLVYVYSEHRGHAERLFEMTQNRLVQLRAKGLLNLQMIDYMPQNLQISYDI